MDLYQPEVNGASRIECPTIPGSGESHLPSHLIPLEGGRWALWRTLALRGAGFPAVGVLKLADSACGSAADSLLEADAQLERARSVILERLQRKLEQARMPERRALERVMHRVKQGRVQELAEGFEEQQEWAAELSAATQRLEVLTGEFHSAFNLALDKISHAIREIAGDERFSEAIIWQNRAAWHRSVEFLQRKDAGIADREFCVRTARVRAHEELIANYLQRYCVKNDSIGFFGPVGWAQFTSAGAAITVQPGPTLVASRSVFLESWGIDAVAATLAQDARLKPWLAPRQLPFILLQHGSVLLPGGASVRISDPEATLIEACDGEHTARELATCLLRRPDCHWQSEDEVFRSLESLRARGFIAWTLEVPLSTEGERNLRKLIDRIGDESLRQTALNSVAEMERGRQAVAESAGDPKALDQALNEFEGTFSRLTGSEATRAAGQTYGGRTLIYEDCRRDIEIAFGPELVEELEPTLTLLLDSARWITFQMSESYRKTLQGIYGELVKKTGSRTLRAIDFWIKADHLNLKERALLGGGVATEFQKRWLELLSLPAGQSRVSYSSEQLRAGVNRAFAAPREGWSAACNHSPDIMIAASGPAAIRRGDYQFVLGELHLAVNTLNTPVFGGRHPHREEIYQAIESDLPNPRLLQVLPKHWPELTARTCPDYISPKDYRLLVSHDSCGLPKSQAIPISNLVIEDSSEGLIVRTLDERLRFDLVEAFAETLSGLVINFFNLLPPRQHTPRVTIDRLVVCRETKRFSPAELDFAYEKDEAARFLAARSWMREQGLPRFMFVKSPIERKPFYVDLDSPIYLNVLAKIIRRAKEKQDAANSLIAFMEMLPSHDQAWLTDVDGNHFTSELRLVAVDRVRPQGSSVH